MPPGQLSLLCGFSIHYFSVPGRVQDRGPTAALLFGRCLLGNVALSHGVPVCIDLRPRLSASTSSPTALHSAASCHATYRSSACGVCPGRALRGRRRSGTTGVKIAGAWHALPKRAGAPANAAAGVKLLHRVGDVVTRGEPLFEIHAQSAAQLEFGQSYAAAHPNLVRFGF